MIEIEIHNKKSKVKAGKLNRLVLTNSEKANTIKKMRKEKV